MEIQNTREELDLHTNGGMNGLTNKCEVPFFDKHGSTQSP